MEGGKGGGRVDFPLLARFAYGRTQPRLTDFSKLLSLLDILFRYGGGGAGRERR